MCQSKDQQSIENGTDENIQPKMNLPQRKKGIYIEEALTRTKFGFFNYILIVISGTIIGATFLENCAIGFVLPVSQCDLDLTTPQKGVLGGIAFVGIICSSHLWGFLADTKGRKFVIQPTIMIAFALSICSSFATNFYVLAVTRFLSGFCMSGPSAAIYAYIGEYHNSANRSRAIMCASVIYGVFCLMLPIFAWFIINQEWYFDIPLLGITYKPWRLFLIICSLPGFLASLALFFIPESPKYTLGQGDINAAIKALEKVNRWNNGKDAEFDVSELLEDQESIDNRQQVLKNKSGRFPLMNSIWEQTAPLFKPPYLGRTLLICTIQFGVLATANGLYMFFAEILNRMASNLDSFTETRIEMCDVINMNKTILSHNQTDEFVCITKLEVETLKQSVLLEILYVIGFAVIGSLVNLVGKFPILFVTFGASGAGGILCMLTNIPIIQVYSFIALMLCGLGVNVISAATIELYPTSLRAMAMSMSMMIGRLGSVVGSNTVAFLLNDHCESAFYLSGTSIIVCAVLCFFIPHIHERATKKETKIEPRMSVLSARG